jgi:oligosaccharide repeat unit polymerase
MLELAIIIHLLLALVNFRVSVNYAYPPFLYSLLWFFVLLSFYLVSEFEVIEIYDLSGGILAIFVTGSILFSIGGFASSFLIGQSDPSVKGDSIPDQLEINKYFDKILFWIPIIFLPLFLFRASQIYISSNIDIFFVGLRTQLVYGDENYGILIYLITIAVFNSVFRLTLNLDTKSKKIKTVISLIVAIIYSVFSTSRTAFFFLLLTILGLKIFRSHFKLRHLLLFTLLGISVYSIFDLLLAKSGSLDDPFLENVIDIQEIFLQYLLGPLAAFDRFLNEPSYIHFGENVFRTFHVILHRLALISTPPQELIQEFVSIPFLTNVYTVYYTYILDFGLIGAFIFVFLIGLFHSSLFHKAKSGDLYYIFFYAILVHPLITSFFNDQYFSILSHWIQYFILGSLAFRFFVKKRTDILETVS